MILDCTQKCICEDPHLNVLHGSCNISSIARCITHSNKANRALYVWKLHCAGWKTHSLTLLKISLVCIDGVSLFFYQYYKQDHRLEITIKFDSLVWRTFEKIIDFSMHNVYWDTLCTNETVVNCCHINCQTDEISTRSTLHPFCMIR